MPLVENTEGKSIMPRKRRTDSFWEPIFDPIEREEFPAHDWNFTNDLMPHHVTFRFSDLQDAIKNRRTRQKFQNINFHKCDFSGIFDFTPSAIVFIECTFDQCDFGLSTWNNTKFTKCIFKRSSISQTRWTDCDFRDCIWNDIGMSGTGTDFERTTITNPIAFIKSAYTNLDLRTLNKYNRKTSYQKMRLESTKATIARSLAKSFANIGEEGAFYESIKAHSNQSCISGISTSLYNLANCSPKHKLGYFIQYLIHFIDYLLLNAAGTINGWGKSISRPAIIGIGLIFLFALVYRFYCPALSNYQSVVKSIEITLLIGYTNHSSSSTPDALHFIVLVNMILGLAWYVIFIPTLVNRICRVR